ATSQHAPVTARLGGSAAATVTVTPSPAVSSLICNPTSVSSGTTTTCTVILTQPAPTGGSTVALASNNNTALPIGGAQALGWTTLSSTTLQSACPPNGFGGSSYAFSDSCRWVMEAWSGGTFDPVRKRLMMFGGGHTGHFRNELY